MGVEGIDVDLAHFPREREPVTVRVRLPRELRADPRQLLGLRVRSGDANALPEPGADATAPALVPLGELVTIEEDVIDKSLYHKNLQPVTYVTGDVAGVKESPVYAILEMNEKLAALDATKFGASDPKLKIFNASQPFLDAEPSMKWDGEWHITIEVFRDLGIAFGVVLVLIYILMVGWFKSFVTPLVVMVAIPFSLIGVLPAHGMMGAFFSATSMIGFMAGGGIVVRNSIILVDFIQLRRICGHHKRVARGFCSDRRLSRVGLRRIACSKRLLDGLRNIRRARLRKRIHANLCRTIAIARTIELIDHLRRNRHQIGRCRDHHARVECVGNKLRLDDWRACFRRSNKLRRPTRAVREYGAQRGNNNIWCHVLQLDNAEIRFRSCECLLIEFRQKRTCLLCAVRGSNNDDRARRWKR